MCYMTSCINRIQKTSTLLAFCMWTLWKRFQRGIVGCSERSVLGSADNETFIAKFRMSFQTGLSMRHCFRQVDNFCCEVGLPKGVPDVTRWSTRRFLWIASKWAASWSKGLAFCTPVQALQCLLWGCLFKAPVMDTTTCCWGMSTQVEWYTPFACIGVHYVNGPSYVSAAAIRISEEAKNIAWNERGVWKAPEERSVQRGALPMGGTFQESVFRRNSILLERLCSVEV